MLTVFAQPNLVESLANGTILVAVATIFSLVANKTMESLSHARSIPRLDSPEKYQLPHSRTFVTKSIGYPIVHFQIVNLP